MTQLHKEYLYTLHELTEVQYYFKHPFTIERCQLPLLTSRFLSSPCHWQPQSSAEHLTLSESTSLFAKLSLNSWWLETLVLSTGHLGPVSLYGERVTDTHRTALELFSLYSESPQSNNSKAMVNQPYSDQMIRYTLCVILHYKILLSQQKAGYYATRSKIMSTL